MGYSMRSRDELLNLLVAIVSFALISFSLYLLSYAPFLALTPNSNIFTEYRSPPFYRPAEWVIARTPLQPLLLEWAEWHDVGHTTEMQVHFFGYGVSDPSEEFDWNMASP